ncbi:hypothetical protein J2Z76_002086 [Sedimentibacter acidaminivorans]|uniref:Tocopherol cyclase n=1 Tax=Sedimentibacter acidaminivorans TaxID=913099 RepID=A0ABS4GF06_9FIRM|nr:tocopherol cyclase family protein [Sedimentibacter acidaminivorans]MBP1926222.1 hypothetical protein [Sedimentibacter acidaminivorans]
MFLKYINEPILYQGRNKCRKYFEGWYFKHISNDLKNTICIIPGITKDECDPHAFVQTIINRNIGDELRVTTHYYRYSINDFKYTDVPFSIKIGENMFASNGIELTLEDDEFSISGKINYSSFTKIKTNIIYPNIMGCFAYLPIMECYHGIVSMNHYLDGSLFLNEEEINFNEGKGYIEKDWGTSFPKEYVWMQCNHFKDKDASIMCSIADIPFLGTSFQGFICNLSFSGREYRFASYNNSKILNINCSYNMFEVTIVKGNLKLEINAKMDKGGVLKAPQYGTMKRTIKEGVNGVISLKLAKKNNEILYVGEGKPCGIEIVKNS